MTNSEEAPSIITAKQAVISAFTTFKELTDSSTETVKNLRLEEVELESTNNRWKITLGYDTETYEKTKTEASRPQSLATLFGTPPDITTSEPLRDYKILHIDSKTGDFISMMFRE